MFMVTLPKMEEVIFFKIAPKKPKKPIKERNAKNTTSLSPSKYLS